MGTFEDLVQRAYVAFYGRPADPEGLTYWATELAKKNGNLSAIIDAFGNSDESQTLYGGQNTAEKVRKIYLQLFNREPEPEGLAWWVTELESGRRSLESAALSIMDGARGADAELIERKVQAAAQFTETLANHLMSRSYGAEDIAVTRSYLSAINSDTTDTELDALLQQTLIGVEDGKWITLTRSAAAIQAGYYTDFSDLEFTKGFVRTQDSLIFASALSYSNTAQDVALVQLNDSLSPIKNLIIGHPQYREEIHGMAADQQGNFWLWGSLETTPPQLFIWRLDPDLTPSGMLTVLGKTGYKPVLNAVVDLGNGKILAVGKERTIADNWDAFAVIINPDMTISAQARFDAPREGSAENFTTAYSLNDGTALLVGERGQILKVDSQLNIIGTLDFDLPIKNLYDVGNGQILIEANASRLALITTELDIISEWYVAGGQSSLTQTDATNFIGYQYPGYFFALELDRSNSSLPQWNVSYDGRQINNQSGYGVGIHRITAEDQAVIAISDNNIFAFNLLHPATPDYSADYRLIAATPPVSVRPLSNLARNTVDWYSEAIDIVTVGTPPTMIPSPYDFLDVTQITDL